MLKSEKVWAPGKSHGQRSLVGYSPWGRQESDTTQQQSGLLRATGGGGCPTGAFPPGPHFLMQEARGVAGKPAFVSGSHVVLMLPVHPGPCFENNNFAALWGSRKRSGRQA